ncbi:MAG: Gfo/Idh/MocA family oxidoreductase [Spirochaetales bacterium]|nr:Gfo/Idh/MocA family oxidoreductase [Spirochaetales bacterium]
MREIGFAIVGCGNIAPFHAEAIRDTEGAELVAVCDKDSSRAAELAEKFSVEAYSDFSEMLKREDVHVVNICLPSGLHESLTTQAANAGKHVMVEKPLDITLEKCDSIIAVCKENRVKLATIFPSRFKPGAAAIRNAISTGRFGKLTLGDVSVKWFRSQEYYDSGDWRGTWEFDGGGALMNQSIHYIDVLQDIMGSVESVSAICSTLVKKVEVEDTAVAVIKFKNGALGTITGTTATYPGLDARIGIHGESGSAVLEGESLVTWEFSKNIPGDEVFKASIGKTTSSGASDPTKNLRSEGHRLQVSNMVTAINENREPMVSGESGRKAVEIICAIYESSRNNGETVYL